MAVTVFGVYIFIVLIFISTRYNACRVIRFETAVDVLQILRGGGIVCHTRLAPLRHFWLFYF